MLEVAKIRGNKAEIIERLAKRNIDFSDRIEHIIALDDKRKNTQFKLDEELAEQNQLAKTIGEYFKSGKAADAETLKARVAQLKEHSNVLKNELTECEEKIQEILYTIPNAPQLRVPNGKTPEENETVRKGGEIPNLSSSKLPHWELAKKYDIIDFELGVKITGAGFPVYKGKGARLQRALINYFLDKAEKAGYSEVMPPLVVNTASGIGTGQLPDKEGQMYHCEVDDLYLIPTAEVPITNIYRDVVLSDNEFPIKNAGYTPCFRREAGSYGAHVRGLNRLHQFDKVEIVQIAHPDKSNEVLEEMVQHVEGLLQELKLPYRVLLLCGGDMGFASSITFDMEVFSAAQEKWLEVSSISNFETFQANRLKLKFKEGANKPQLAHTLNGSALALPRILASILENNQTEQGIRIPDVLIPYTGFEWIN
jgi:seryl-tRNA synthetase